VQRAKEGCATAGIFIGLRTCLRSLKAAFGGRRFDYPTSSAGCGLPGVYFLGLTGGRK
jgi:hypothetical protein